MGWRSHLNRRNRRWGSRWSGWGRRRRRYVERNSRAVERVQLIETALPHLLGFGGRRDLLDFIILIGWKVLIGRFTEEGMPVGAIEVGELGWISHDSSKPIIERHMELRSDGSGLKIQHQGDHTRVPIAHPHVHVAFRARLPSRDLLATRDVRKNSILTERPAGAHAGR
jgi:hypothetical protein